MEVFKLQLFMFHSLLSYPPLENVSFSDFLHYLNASIGNKVTVRIKMAINKAIGLDCCRNKVIFAGLHRNKLYLTIESFIINVFSWSWGRARD